MAKVVISEFMDDAAVKRLSAVAEVHYDKTLGDRPEALLPLLADCEALIVRNRTQVRGNVLEAAPKLKVVGRLGVGLDNIDLDFCKKHSIAVFPATGANNVAVAEYVLAGMLMLVRGCYQNSKAVASGSWPRESSVGGEIYGRTLGLVGFGAIAREVAKRAHAFGMQLIAYDPCIPVDDPIWDELLVHCCGMNNLLAKADFISLHVPLTEETRHLINAERLAQVKPGAFLINTARGGVVDDEALARALHSGSLAGAMLDVYEQEPLPSGTTLDNAPNCILTPHVAGVTHESNVRVSDMTATKVIEALGA